MERKKNKNIEVTRVQIFYLPKTYAILLCFVLWPVFQVAAALLALKMNDAHFSHQSFLYRCRKWEKNGSVYQKLFKVRAWKKFLPDGGAVIKGGYRKRYLSTLSNENLEKFLVESCRAEFGHLLAMLPFWVFGLFAPPGVILWMLLYALVMNAPCIIVQRYNRPRVAGLLRNQEQRKESDENI